MSLNATMGGRKSERVFGAVEVYLRIAADFGIDPVHMALQWVLTRPFSAIPIFGATTMPQLERILQAPAVPLSDELLAAVAKAHKSHPMPF